MVMKCDEVMSSLSEYLEVNLDSAQSTAMTQHFDQCKHCTAVLQGTRNIVALYGDERMQAVPFGFEHRLHRRMEEVMHHSNGTSLGWLVLVVATILVAGSFELATSSAVPNSLRSQHAHPAGESMPRDMMVVVAEGSKTFHLAKCRFIHESANDKSNLRTISAQQAKAEGFVPCIRCLGEYLTLGPSSKTDHAELADAAGHVDH